MPVIASQRKPSLRGCKDLFPGKSVCYYPTMIRSLSSLILTSLLAAAALAEAAPQKAISPAEADAHITQRVEPTVPALAKAARIGGKVKLHIVISPSGDVSSVEVISGHPILVASAVEAVKKWKYKPFAENDAPMTVATDVEIEFPHPSGWAQVDAPSAIDGGITGFVLTEDGQPAKRATPCASVRPGNTTCGSVDDEGRFTIEHLKWGTYQVFALNADGYSESWPEVVTVSADQPWPNVTILLRSHGGLLVGSLTDKLTGKPIQGQLEYIAIDGGGSGSGSTLVNGEFHVPVPPNCDVLVLAMAKGYKGWVYTDASRASRPVLRLAAGERKLFDIQLEPLPSASR